MAGMDLLPVLGFAIAASITPGPNVLMVAAAAAGVGLRGAVPMMLGISLGFPAMIVVLGFGLAMPAYKDRLSREEAGRFAGIIRQAAKGKAIQSAADAGRR